MLSIVINLFILILRISAHELQYNSTLSTPTHRFDAAAVMNIKTTDNEKTSEIGEQHIALMSFVLFPRNIHDFLVHA